MADAVSRVAYADDIDDMMDVDDAVVDDDDDDQYEPDQVDRGAKRKRVDSAEDAGSNDEDGIGTPYKPEDPMAVHLEQLRTNLKTLEKTMRRNNRKRQKQAEKGGHDIAHYFRDEGWNDGIVMSGYYVPDEIAVQLYYYLGAQDARSLASCCRNWSRLSKDDTISLGPVRLSLMTHQREALKWMRQHEKDNKETFNSHARAGILLADTGTGKTATTLALIASDYCTENQDVGATPYDSASLTEEQLFNRPKTLIFVPSTLLSQWHDEAKQILNMYDMNARLRQVLPTTPGKGSMYNPHRIRWLTYHHQMCGSMYDSIDAAFLLRHVDVILISTHQLCQNSNRGTLTKPSAAAAGNANAAVDAQHAAPHNTAAPLSSSTWTSAPWYALLENYKVHIHRVVVDEIHSIGESRADKLRDICKKIYKVAGEGIPPPTHRRPMVWGLTATLPSIHSPGCRALRAVYGTYPSYLKQEHTYRIKRPRHTIDVNEAKTTRQGRDGAATVHSASSIVIAAEEQLPPITQHIVWCPYVDASEMMKHHKSIKVNDWRECGRFRTRESVTMGVEWLSQWYIQAMGHGRKGQSIAAAANTNQSTRMRQAAESLRAANVPVRGKFATLLELLQDSNSIGTGERAVIFVQSAELFDMMHYRLAAHGHQVFLYGQKQTSHARHRNIKAFETSDSTANHRAVLLCTIALAKQGLNLQYGANHIVFVEHPASKTQRTQAWGRVYRKGQKLATHIWQLVVKDTIEEFDEWRAQESQRYTEKMKLLRFVEEGELVSTTYSAWLDDEAPTTPETAFGPTAWEDADALRRYKRPFDQVCTNQEVLHRAMTLSINGYVPADDIWERYIHGSNSDSDECNRQRAWALWCSIKFPHYVWYSEHLPHVMYHFHQGSGANAMTLPQPYVRSVAGVVELRTTIQGLALFDPTHVPQDD